MLIFFCQILDSELFELMHQNGDYTHFYFCYRWFLLDFKRGITHFTWEHFCYNGKFQGSLTFFHSDHFHLTMSIIPVRLRFLVLGLSLPYLTIVIVYMIHVYEAIVFWSSNILKKLLFSGIAGTQPTCSVLQFLLLLNCTSLPSLFVCNLGIWDPLFVMRESFFQTHPLQGPRL